MASLGRDNFGRRIVFAKLVRMRVRFSQSGRELKVRLTPERGDRPKRSTFRLSRRIGSMRMPAGWSLSETHPDLLGLAALLISQPFTGDRLTVDPLPSTHFADSVPSMSIDASKAVRARTRATGPPALSFSGGADSTAALLVMPPDTICLNARRDFPFRYRALERPYRAARRRQTPPFNPDHGSSALDWAGKRHTVIRVCTNLELMRWPVGWPVDLAVGLPAVLLADELSVSSINYGSTLSGLNRLGEYFTPYRTRWHSRFWSSAFAAAGVPLSLPVAGLTSAGTQMIVDRLGLRDEIQSCPRAWNGQPCRRCSKCAYRQMLEPLIAGESLSDSDIDSLLGSRAARERLSAVPMSYEVNFTYVGWKYQGDHPAMRLLQRRVRSADQDLEWYERFHSNQIHLVSSDLAQGVAEGIRRSVCEADSGHWQAVTEWDVTGYSDDPEVIRDRDQLVAALAELDRHTKGGSLRRAPRVFPAREE